MGGIANRRKKRPSVGLALSSGGAKGLAHIGVIQILEENGIEIDAVSGTSMGAYVGGLWASGLNGRELESLAASMSTPRDRWKLIDPIIPPRRGFIGGDGILRRLRKSLGRKRFEDMETPFAAVATKLESLERDILSEGDVASAILASLAVPGVVAPVIRDGVEYIDGGVCDPLPVSVLRDLWGIDCVIAVNVLPPVGTVGGHRIPERGATGWKCFGVWLNHHFNYFAPGNLLDILRCSAMGSQMRLVERSARKADVLISAVNAESGWHDYHRYDEYIELGRSAGLEALPQIRALLGGEEERAVKLREAMEVASCA
tara:strand:+ start:2882 stop:3829 length:948 start_codon:yes stop_codon:yes gene_type:complete